MGCTHLTVHFGFVSLRHRVSILRKIFERVSRSEIIHVCLLVCIVAWNNSFEIIWNYCTKSCLNIIFYSHIYKKKKDLIYYRYLIRYSICDFINLMREIQTNREADSIYSCIPICIKHLLLILLMKNFLYLLFWFAVLCNMTSASTQRTNNGVCDDGLSLL